MAATGSGRGGGRSYTAVLWHSEEDEEEEDEDEQKEEDKEDEDEQSHPRSVDQARRPLDRPPEVHSSL